MSDIDKLSDLLDISLTISDNLDLSNSSEVNSRKSNMPGPSATTPQSSNSINTNLLTQHISLIPTFNGDANKLENFLSICDRFVVQYYKENEDDFNSFILLAITSKLTNDAQNLIYSRPELNTWDLIKNALRISFGELRDRESLEQDLITITQHRNESLIDLSERIKLIRSKLNSKIRADSNLDANMKLIYLNQYDKLALNTFIRNLRGEIKTIIRLRNPSTIEQAISLVIEEENFNYNATQLQKNSNQTTNKLPVHKPNNPNTNFYRNYNKSYPSPMTYQISPYFNQQQTRPNFNLPNRNFQTPSTFPSQPINVQPRQITHNYPTNRQVFGPPQNVFKPQPSRVINDKPEPMSIQSRVPSSFDRNPNNKLFSNFNPPFNKQIQGQSRELNNVNEFQEPYYFDSFEPTISNDLTENSNDYFNNYNMASTSVPEHQTQTLENPVFEPTSNEVDLNPYFYQDTNKNENFCTDSQTDYPT